MVHLALWELCEGLPCWGPWRIGRKALEKGIYFHRSPNGEPDSRIVYRGFERWMKGAVGMERLSMKRLSAEGGWGGLFVTADP
jgi:hypothetical protein